MNFAQAAALQLALINFQLLRVLFNVLNFYNGCMSKKNQMNSQKSLLQLFFKAKQNMSSQKIEG
uniref:Uncharacterized protein n=1 Tax=Arion vulgaris TaxID=1028688 RepID=A0A0B7BTH8_9EUPU